MFGPNSRVILTGTELFKDLLSTGFMTIACIGLTIFCTVVLSGVEKNDPKTKEQKFREKFGNQAPGLSMPGMPMPQLGDEEEDD